MNGMLKTTSASWAMLAMVGCVGLAGFSIAAPPGSKPAAVGVPHGSGPYGIHPLDLRPPSGGGFGASTSRAGSDRLAGRGTALRGAQHADTSAADDARPLGMTAPPIHANSGAEEFARRFHHDGLPVARLWENHAAFLSLGLNQKGKPGVWLVQKIH